MTERKPKPAPDDPEQCKRFLEAAREAGADESAEGADRAFRKVIFRPSRPSPAPVAARGNRSKAQAFPPYFPFRNASR